MEELRDFLSEAEDIALQKKGELGLSLEPELGHIQAQYHFICYLKAELRVLKNMLDAKSKAAKFQAVNNEHV